MGMEEVINKRVLEDHAWEIIGEITRKEIEKVMFGLANNKASGLDGYYVVFFKKAWHIVEEDVMEAIKSFFFPCS